MKPILLDGAWRSSQIVESFSASSPSDGETLAAEYPVSSWHDCDRALDAAVQAFMELLYIPAERRARFLEVYATNLEASSSELVQMAHRETALPIKPRLADVELPRTLTQLRQAAQAARDGSWMQPVIDTKLNIRSCFAPIGPVVVFGPNNFPFAFHGVAGGDFAGAIAAGCPVIAKAHPLHPGTSELLAKSAQAAAEQTGMPPGTVQMLYHLRSEDGQRLVADPRVGTSAFTGSRKGGLALKRAADAAGKLIYLEMSSLNPIVILPGALAERGEILAPEVADSGLAGAGQFCTSPNLLFLLESPEADRFVHALVKLYSERASAPLLSRSGRDALHRSVQALVSSGAQVLTGAEHHSNSTGACYRNTVLQVNGSTFLQAGQRLQEEAFGNATTVVLCATGQELLQALKSLEGNLTASIYSGTQGSDDALYARVAECLRPRCGRLLNDKMPTGVALSPAMNHGGPYPSTAHPGFTSVGIPRSLQRFVALQCYDAVRQDRLPPELRDTAPHEQMWRSIDGTWVRG